MSFLYRFTSFLIIFFSLAFSFACGGKQVRVKTNRNPYLATGQKFEGESSWYGGKFNGRKTASGERFNMHLDTAAHKTLPFGTLLKVTNTANNKSMIVRVNDRGPYHGGRVLDLSYGAAKHLEFAHIGTANVKAEVVVPNPLVPSPLLQKKIVKTAAQKSLPEKIWTSADVAKDAVAITDR